MRRLLQGARDIPLTISAAAGGDRPATFYPNCSRGMCGSKPLAPSSSKSVGARPIHDGVGAPAGRNLPPDNYAATDDRLREIGLRTM